MQHSRSGLDLETMVSYVQIDQRVVYDTDSDDDLDEKISFVDGMRVLLHGDLKPYGALRTSGLITKCIGSCSTDAGGKAPYIDGAYWSVCSDVKNLLLIGVADSGKVGARVSDTSMFAHEDDAAPEHNIGQLTPNLQDVVDARPMISLSEPGGVLIFLGAGGVVEGLRFRSEMRCPVEVFSGDWCFRRCEFQAPALSPSFSACVVTGGRVRFEECEFRGELCPRPGDSDFYPHYNSSIALLDVYGRGSWKIVEETTSGSEEKHGTEAPRNSSASSNQFVWDRTESCVEVVNSLFHGCAWSGVFMAGGSTLAVRNCRFERVGVGRERNGNSRYDGCIFKQFRESVLNVDAEQANDFSLAEHGQLIRWE